jgi:hypothetical protein
VPGLPTFLDEFLNFERTVLDILQNLLVAIEIFACHYERVLQGHPCFIHGMDWCEGLNRVKYLFSNLANIPTNNALH